ncbi:hypothetical protein CTI12_AA468810 [Artemisia annua]|uniref:Uncharacterized protein n=1 Tax=Artemisia annua TaxID=35608 RepID=A0A2U1LPJ5_ARTAN|nr:hypothetical protein CTI12_AA468810 [Artemisia annua]
MIKLTKKLKQALSQVQFMHTECSSVLQNMHLLNKSELLPLCVAGEFGPEVELWSTVLACYYTGFFDSSFSSTFSSSSSILLMFLLLAKVETDFTRKSSLYLVAVNGGSEGGGFCVSNTVNNKTRKRKGKKCDSDWENFVIETFLHHQVKEEEIEKGYYNTLLDLHVLNPGI